MRSKNKNAEQFFTDMPRKSLNLWWVWLDSNQRPRDYEFIDNLINFKSL